MPSNDKSVPRILQQQPERDSDAGQQQSGTREYQDKPGAKGDQQMGEGSYQGTRDYEQNIHDYLKDADVEADAKAARPKTEQEAREMDEAEREGRSHGKGER
ncbi:MAG TPA: hypothetical protein VKP68_02600 [Ramlibacter sp.]|nr:hypothetical protein [Ramlibacter sp.]